MTGRLAEARSRHLITREREAKKTVIAGMRAKGGGFGSGGT